MVTHGQQVLVHFGKTVVVGEIVPDRVLPRARRYAAVVGKALRDPVVNLLDRQAFTLRRLNGQESEAAEGVGRSLKTGGRAGGCSGRVGLGRR